MKYIMLELEGGAKLPIIFPDCLTHSLVAGAIQLAVDCLDRKKDLRPQHCESLLERGAAKPVSAGFIDLGTAVRVYGESVSLGDLKACTTDADRVILGDSVMYMPDELLPQLTTHLREIEAVKT